MGELIDFGNYPEISFAGSEAHNLGTDIRFVLWDWYRIDGLWRRKITGLVRRPLAGWVENQAQARLEILGPMPLCQACPRTH